MAADEDNFRIFKLEPYQELSVEIHGVSESIEVELLDGVAEIFGVEMILHKLSIFTSSFAVFSWRGGTLKLVGFASKIKTLSHNYAVYDLHRRLQDFRIRAKENGVTGPVVLVAGPTDVGKSTLTRCLLNYAARSGNCPLFVDLDVGQSSISIPGTLGVLPVDSPGDLVTGYDDKNLSAYFYGYKAPSFNILLYLSLISKLSKTVYYRMKDSPEILNSGIIIDTCGWVTGQGYRSILHAAISFCVTTVFVLGDKKLYFELRKDLPRSVEIVRIHKLEGVVVKNKTDRTNRRDRIVHDYFYGSEFHFEPYLFQIKYSDVKIIKCSCPTKVSKDMYDEPHKYLFIENVAFGPELLDCVLAISYADIVDEDMITTSVLGFVCIKNIDFENQVLTILSVKPGPLPKKILIMGDLSFHDDN